MPGGVNRLLLTTDAVGGVWRYTADLARGLAARDVECVVAVMGPAASEAQRRELEGVRGVTLAQTGLPLDWTAENAGALAEASGKLAAMAALTGVTGIHLHAPALVGEARWPAPVVAVAHSDVGTWWRAVRGGEPPAEFAWRIAATGAGLRAAARVIVPSGSHGKALREVYGDVVGSIVLNGAVPPPDMSGVVRERAVLTAGRLWDEGKGVAMLDRAAAGLPVRAAGPVSGPNGASIAIDNLALLGSLDAAGMARAYAGASVFISMARYEPFGLSVLEAAQAGMRLLLADIPTFRELWVGVAAFVADEIELPRALRWALRAEGDGGAQKRSGRYTLERMVEGTLSVHRRAGGVRA